MGCGCNWPVINEMPNAAITLKIKSAEAEPQPETKPINGPPASMRLKHKIPIGVTGNEIKRPIA